MRIFKAVTAGLLTVVFSSAVQAQAPVSEKSLPSYDLPPISATLLKDMKMRIYDFDSEIKDGKKMNHRGLYDPILGFYCTWTESVTEDSKGNPADVDVLSRECDVVEADPEFLNKRILVDFGAGYDHVAAPSPKNIDGDTIEVISRLKGSWTQSYIRDWDSKENAVCMRYMVFLGKNPEDAIVKDDNVFEQCVQFFAGDEFQQFKSDNVGPLYRAMAPQ